MLRRGGRGVYSVHTQASCPLPSDWPAVFAPMVPGDRPDRLPARDQNYPRPCAWPLQRPELPQTPRKLYRLLWIQSLAAAQLAYSDVLHYPILKGQCHKIFDPRFFLMTSTHLGFIMHVRKNFQKGFNFTDVFACAKISKVSLAMTPRSQIQQLYDTPESNIFVKFFTGFFSNLKRKTFFTVFFTIFTQLGSPRLIG